MISLPQDVWRTILFFAQDSRVSLVCKELCKHNAWVCERVWKEISAKIEREKVESEGSYYFYLFFQDFLSSCGPNNSRSGVLSVRSFLDFASYLSQTLDVLLAPLDITFPPAVREWRLSLRVTAAGYPSISFGVVQRDILPFFLTKLLQCHATNVRNAWLLLAPSSLPRFKKPAQIHAYIADPAHLPSLAACTALRVGVMSSQDLSMLPVNELSFFPSLSILDISSCHNIKHIPDHIDTLVHLTALSLPPLLPYLPPTLWNLSSLTELDFGLVRPFPHVSEGLARLKSLVSLSMSGATGVPETVYGLVQPCSLSLLSVSLPCLPDDVGRLTSLEYLTISKTNLSSISPQIGSLRYLQELVLSCNQIEELPEEIGLLSRLTRLDVSQNRLKQLPASVFFLSRLESLRADVNLISSLPSVTPRLPSLLSLNLRSNNLTELPSILCNLPSLQTLQLASNHIKTISSEIGSLSELKMLDLSSNDLALGLPAEMSALSQLQTLSLRNNGLTHLPPSFSSLSNLFDLDLSLNGFTSFPGCVCKMYHLGHLNLRNNKLHSVPDLSRLRILSRLDVSENEPHIYIDSTTMPRFVHVTK